MRHVLEVVGGETHEFDVSGETYADLLDEVGLRPGEVAVVVDGSPVPEDRPVDASRAKVVRLVAGG